MLDIGKYIEAAIEWMTENFEIVFDVLNTGIGGFIEGLQDVLFGIPFYITILLLGGLAWFKTQRGVAVFTVLGLVLIYFMGYWEQTMDTLALVLSSTLIALLIGIPLGLWAGNSDRADKILRPIMDFMQTMPAFVYLIPAVAFFGIGMVPGVFASLIFATPPTVRFTNLGIRQVSQELVEASEAFGSTGAQKLFKVELPMAKATIMAGINQTVMLALSMVVIASMIGAPGLGREVLSSLQRAQVGTGFVAGIGIVILAIIIDRFTQNMNKKKQ